MDIPKPKKIRVNILFDTNFVRPKNKKDFVSMATKHLVEEFGQNVELCLLLPEVVAQELKYQAFKEANENFVGYRSNCRFLEHMTNEKFSIIDVNEEKVYEFIAQKQDEKLIEFGFSTLGTPHEVLSTAEIQKLSVRRIGVFEDIFKEIDGKPALVGEKGLRDYLILKTFEHYVSDESSEGEIILVTNDKKMIEELEKISNARNNFRILSDSQAVTSYLTSIVQESGVDWIQGILPKAGDCFFSRDTASGLWFISAREDIKKKFQKEIAELAPKDDHLFASRPEHYWQFESMSYVIENPSFEGKKGKLHRWKSRILLKKRFIRQSPFDIARGSLDMESAASGNVWSALSVARLSGVDDSGSRNLNELSGLSRYASRTEERILELEFEVSWTSSVSDDAEFSELKITSIENLKEENQDDLGFIALTQPPNNKKKNRFGSIS